MSIDDVISLNRVRHHQSEHEDHTGHEPEGLRYGFVLTVNFQSRGSLEQVAAEFASRYLNRDDRYQMNSGEVGPQSDAAAS